ncbi:MAG TPA: glycerate kinase [Steroidobacteraceae bacterium]|nr:glycerate kinase [Steroidobacteraceae bacterium]
MPPPDLLRALFAAAVAAASPAQCVPPHLPAAPRGRTVVIGAGKAAAAMAAAVEQHWNGPLAGLVVTRYGHSVPCSQVEVVEAGHPLPDEAGERAARGILELLRGLSADDLVLCLISGGGSSLLSLPALPIAPADKRDINRELLRSGANIAEINCVRKHLSAIKGGRLALAAWPAKVVTLVISDVPGDDLSVIASGPTVADPTTSAAALEILERYSIAVPATVRHWLRDPASETPKPGDPRLAGVQNTLVATPLQSLAAAAKRAAAAGYRPLILGDAIEGEARECAVVHAGIARSVAAHGVPLPAPCALISGGETTVTVRGAGRGGRNAEFLLGLALALQGAPDIWALAADTDGIDGTEDNAGALLAPDTLARAAAANLEARALLVDNDGYGFFSALGDLLVTGPTRTNVNDFRAILIGRAEHD